MTPLGHSDFTWLPPLVEPQPRVAHTPRKKSDHAQLKQDLILAIKTNDVQAVRTLLARPEFDNGWWEKIPPQTLMPVVATNNSVVVMQALVDKQWRVPSSLYIETLNTCLYAGHKEALDFFLAHKKSWYDVDFQPSSIGCVLDWGHLVNVVAEAPSKNPNTQYKHQVAADMLCALIEHFEESYAFYMTNSGAWTRFFGASLHLQHEPLLHAALLKLPKDAVAQALINWQCHMPWIHRDNTDLGVYSFLQHAVVRDDKIRAVWEHAQQIIRRQHALIHNVYKKFDGCTTADEILPHLNTSQQKILRLWGDGRDAQERALGLPLAMLLQMSLPSVFFDATTRKDVFNTPNFENEMSKVSAPYFVPASLLHGLINAGAPVLTQVVSTEEGKRGVADILQDCGHMHRFVQQVKFATLLAVVEAVPQMWAWRDPWGNTVAHYFFVYHDMDMADHKKLLRVAPELYTSANQQGYCAADTIVWEDDTQKAAFDKMLVRHFVQDEYAAKRHKGVGRKI